MYTIRIDLLKPFLNIFENCIVPSLRSSVLQRLYLWIRNLYSIRLIATKISTTVLLNAQEGSRTIHCDNTNYIAFPVALPATYIAENGPYIVHPWCELRWFNAAAESWNKLKWCHRKNKNCILASKYTHDDLDTI